jgi:hypothetical protein
MTEPKWLIGVLTIFVAMSLLCGFIEGTYLSSSSGDVPALLYSFIHPNFSPQGIWAWIGNLWKILWFDYSFFTGGWRIFKYAIFWPISAGLIVSYGLAIGQSLISAGASLVNNVAGFLTGRVR